MDITNNSNVLDYQEKEAISFHNFLDYVKSDKWLVDLGSIFFIFWYKNDAKIFIDRYKALNPNLTEITDKDYILPLKPFEGVSHEFLNN